ncbi:hypothetical protein [Carboxylicivirga sp. N1Y90]|uniref:hypothetical protein n=1 Tax=Carboxylicivirga fragile TaxID=3417571 RepID=UPI003D337A12|nr:hypothetical protein [Marinilabiliaceae bacterium N1Y90]
MKAYTRLLTILSLYILSVVSVFADNTPVEWLEEFTSEVVTKSNTYTQEFKWVDRDKYLIQMSVQRIDKKGRSEEKEFFFYLPDIDENALQFKATGEYITVFLRTQLSQKFMFEEENGEMKSYLNEITLFTDEVGKARKIIEVFKSQLPESRKSLNLWQTANDAKDWIQANVTSVNYDAEEFEQSISIEGEGRLLSFERNFTNSKGLAVAEEYVLNITDIDISKPMLVITGNRLSIKLETKENHKYVSKHVNGEIQNYSNNMVIYADDLARARNLINAVRFVVPKTKDHRVELGSASESLDFLNANSELNQVGSNQFEHVFQFTSEEKHKLIIETSKVDAKEVETIIKEEVSIVDLEPRAQIAVSGKNIKVVLLLKENHKFFKVEKNEVKQSFTSKAFVYAASVEQARNMVHALSYLVDNDTFEPKEFASEDEVSTWLSSEVSDVVLGLISYEQEMNIDKSKENVINLHLNSTNEDVTKKMVFKCFPQDINAKALKIEVSGKEMFVDVSTGKLKYVARTLEDSPENYDNEMRVYFDDSGKAKSFINAIKFLHSKMANVEHGFESQDAAIAFLNENVVTVTLDKYEHKQAINLEMADCIFTYTNASSDSKGGYNEWIYEFTASDLGKNAANIKVVGKSVAVVLTTRGESKLIKPYKNNDPQKFVSNMQVYAPDILTAKRLREAFLKVSEECKMKQ